MFYRVFCLFLYPRLSWQESTIFLANRVLRPRELGSDDSLQNKYSATQADIFYGAEYLSLQRQKFGFHAAFDVP